MAQDHRSFFSYAITRPFPFRWYTPVIVLGGIIFTVLFTFLNLASNGYDLIVQTSFDPNATVSQEQWLRYWPSYLTSKINPICQPVNLPVNGQIFTNQTALTYVLTAVWQQQNESMIILPSLTYYNNVLKDCFVTSIGVDFEALDQSANQFSYSEFNAAVRSYVTCQISNSLGTVFFNLTQTYNYVPASISFSGVSNGFLGTAFLARDQQTRASLWWGESLMSNYWAYSSRLMQEIRENQTDYGELGIRKGTLSFTPKKATADITDLDFFDPDYRFVVDLGGGRSSFVCCLPEKLRTVALLDQSETYPNIWIPVDTLVKSAYSTILIDLGQADTSTRPNILTNATALQYFTANFTTIRHHTANADPGPERDPYDTLHPTTGPLYVTPSVISTRYLCQVPQLKSTSNLIVAILVANLVLLRTVWQLFKFSVEAYLSRSRPNAMLCEGCAAAGLINDARDSHEIARQDLSYGSFVQGATVYNNGAQYAMVSRDVSDTAPEKSAGVKQSPS